MRQGRPRRHLTQHLLPRVLLVGTAVNERRVTGFQLRCELVDDLVVLLERYLAAWKVTPHVCDEITHIRVLRPGGWRT